MRRTERRRSLRRAPPLTNLLDPTDGELFDVEPEYATEPSQNQGGRPDALVAAQKKFRMGKPPSEDREIRHFLCGRFAATCRGLSSAVAARMMSV